MNRFESEIKAYERGDRKRMPRRGAVLFTGSSTIRLWDTLRTDFPEWPVLNRGFGGSEVSDLLELADRLIFPYAPRILVVYSGDNDLAHGKGALQVADDFRRLVRRVRSERPAMPILLIGLKPSPSRWALVDAVRDLNRCLEEQAAHDRDLYLAGVFERMLGADGKPRADFYAADGLHLSPAGYALWREIVGKRLKDVVNQMRPGTGAKPARKRKAGSPRKPAARKARA